jgi:hypothetical protein
LGQRIRDLECVSRALRDTGWVCTQVPEPKPFYGLTNVRFVTDESMTIVTNISNATT